MNFFTGNNKGFSLHCNFLIWILQDSGKVFILSINFCKRNFQFFSRTLWSIPTVFIWSIDYLGWNFWLSKLKVTAIWIVFCKKGVLTNLAKFTRKHLCWTLCFNKQFHSKLYWKDTLTRIFSCEFCLVFHCLKNVRIWSYSGPYSVRRQEDTDENNSAYGHFLRSVLEKSFFL